MCAVSSMAVFCSFFMLSWYGAHAFLNDFEMVPVPPIITGITLALHYYYYYYYYYCYYYYCN
jgi:hypothetical protein